MHAEALDFIRRSVAQLTVKNVVEIGSLYTALGAPVAHNPLRELFPQVQRYIGIDVRPGPTVDIVADGATFQPRFTPDLVLCCELLEHVDPGKQIAIIENAYRILAPGGTLLITTATEPRAPHTWDGHPQGTPGVDYWNVDPALMAKWFPAYLLAVEVDRTRGDLYVLARAPIVAYA